MCGCMFDLQLFIFTNTLKNKNESVLTRRWQELWNLQRVGCTSIRCFTSMAKRLQKNSSAWPLASDELIEKLRSWRTSFPCFQRFYYNLQPYKYTEAPLANKNNQNSIKRNCETWIFKNQNVSTRKKFIKDTFSSWKPWAVFFLMGWNSFGAVSPAT